MSKQDKYISLASVNMQSAYRWLEIAYEHIEKAFDGNEPGYPAPDSPDARAWDYLDAIGEAQRAIGNRLNTWDDGDYDE